MRIREEYKLRIEFDEEESDIFKGIINKCGRENKRIGFHREVFSDKEQKLLIEIKKDIE